MTATATASPSQPATPNELRAFMAGETVVTGAQPGGYESLRGGQIEVYRPGFAGRPMDASEISDADAEWLLVAGLYAGQAAGADNRSMAAALELAMVRHNMFWAGGRRGSNPYPWTWG